MDPSLNNNGDNNREQNLGAQALESMPSYAEHMQAREEATREKSFSELSADERPEGVRDEQDYREYLAERKAKYEQATKTDERVFEKIRDIKDPDSRDLVTSMLPFFYNDRSVKEDGSRSIRNEVGAVFLETAASYMNGDQERSLSDELNDLAKKYYGDNPSPEDTRRCNAVFRGIDKLNSLALGQKIDRYAEEKDDKGRPVRATFDFPAFDTTVYFRSISESDLYAEYLGDHVQHDGRAALLAAQDIVEKDKNTASYYDKLMNLKMVKQLGEAPFLGEGAAEYFKRNNERRLNAVVKSIEESSHLYDFKEELNGASVKLGDSGLFDIVASKKAERIYNAYANKHHNYLDDLELGRKILAGEDWQKIK